MTTILIHNLILVAIAASFLLDVGQKEQKDFRGIASKIIIKSRTTSPALSAYKDLYDTILINKSDEQESINQVELYAGSSEYEPTVYDEAAEIHVAYVEEDKVNQYKSLNGIKISKSDSFIISKNEKEIVSRIGQYNVTTSYTPRYEVRSVKTKSNKKIVITHKNKRVQPRADKESVARKSTNKTEFVNVSNDDEEMKKVKISGQVLLTEGLALTDEFSSITVIHNVTGEDRGFVKVKKETGLFDLTINQWSGVLYAELRDRFGYLTGVGELSLINTKRSENISIAIKPVSKTVSGTVISGYSHMENIIPISAVKIKKLATNDKALSTDEDGKFDLGSMLPGSTTLVRMTKPGYWPSVSTVSANNRNTFKLFSVKNIESLLGLSVDDRFYNNAKDMGIILGRITFNGSELEGAKVEISTDTVQPTYFSSFVPDLKLNKTSANGRFALFMLDTGTHALRVKYQGEYYPAEVVVAEKGHVTYIELEIKPTTKTKVILTDVETGLAVDVLIDIEGIGSVERAQNGVAHIGFTAGNGSIELMTLGDELYPSVRTKLQKNQYFKNIRLPRRDRVESLLGPVEEFYKNGKNIFMGQVEKDNFRVNVLSYLPTGVEVIYFNKEYAKVERGVAGGGFIVITDQLRYAELIVEGESTGVDYHEFISNSLDSIDLRQIDFSQKLY